MLLLESVSPLCVTFWLRFNAQRGDQHGDVGLLTIVHAHKLLPRFFLSPMGFFFLSSTGLNTVQLDTTLRSEAGRECEAPGQ